MQIQDEERFPSVSLVLVIDRSGSMTAEEDGVTKIQLAAEGAVRALQLLNQNDEMTLITVDEAPDAIIGPVTAANRDEAIEQMRRLGAGGLGRVARRRRAVAEHDNAPGGVGRQEGQAQPQRLGQIGVKAAGLRGEGGQVVGRVEAAQRLLDQGVGPEEDDPGAVVRPHRADSLAHERLGRRGALAAHRVGAVDQKDHSQIIHRPRQLRPGQAQDEQGQDGQPQDQPHPAGARPRPWPAASRPCRPDPPGHQRQRHEQQ